ncbi:MAG TPA: hypothetical protein VGH28_25605 [Polyangiaceae bacterium]|jgi:hypothetical protein
MLRRGALALAALSVALAIATAVLVWLGLRWSRYDASMSYQAWSSRSVATDRWARAAAITTTATGAVTVAVGLVAILSARSRGDKRAGAVAIASGLLVAAAGLVEALIGIVSNLHFTG